MPNNKIIYPWQRYWFPEADGTYQKFIQNGFLRLPPEEYSRFYPAVPKPLTDLTSIPVLLLLGDPGYGKSYTLRDEQKRLTEHQPDDLITFCDLKTYGAGDQDSLKNQLFNTQKLEQVKNGKHLWILLDGLDECGLHDPVSWLVREFIQKIDTPERTFVRISSRPTQSLESLETAISDQWKSISHKPVERWRLCPLLEQDVITAAEICDIESKSLLSAIAERGIEQLAALPVTLQFILRLYQQADLPSKRAEIFEKGLKLLCEDSPERRKARIKTDIPAEMRFQTAARIATGYILQGCNGIWNGPSVECANGLFDAKQVTCREEIEINEQTVTETLEETGIFAQLDGQRFQFASRTFGEFMAAWFIAQSKVPTSQKLKVLLHPHSQRLIPDLHETAAWLAALDSDFLTWLVHYEPEAALEADFATLAQSDLPVLVDGLLQLADKEQRLNSDSEKLTKLNYPGLEAHLRSFIDDKDNPLASRKSGICIANACKLQGLGKALANIALDQNEDLGLRIFAVTNMENMSDDAKKMLIPLVTNALNPSLKANVLSILGFRLLEGKVVFEQISPDFIENADGDFRYQIHDDQFLNQLKTEGIIAGLEWISKYAPIGPDLYVTGKLKSKLLAKAFDYLHEKSVVIALVSAMKSLRYHYNFLFDELEKEEQKDFFSNTLHRQILLAEIFKQVDADEIWTFLSIDCLREEDCMWLFEQFDRASSEPEHHTIACSIDHLIWRYENRQAFEEALMRAGIESIEPNSILVKHLKSWVKPMDLTTPETIDLKKRYYKIEEFKLRTNQPSKSKNKLPQPPIYYIQENLAACEAGNMTCWANLIVSLALEEDGTQKSPNGPDSLTGWQNADTLLRKRIEEVAIIYLQQAIPPTENELLTNPRTIAQAACGLAVAILAETKQLQRLPPEHLSRWALTVVTHFFEPENQRQLFREIRPLIPDAFDAAVLKVADQDAESGNIHLLQSGRKIWHPSFSQQLIDTRLNSSNWPFHCRLHLASLLLESHVDFITQELINWLKTNVNLDNRCAIAKILFLRVPAKSWDVIQTLLIEDREFSIQFISQVSSDAWRNRLFSSELNIEQLGWLYDKLRALFPPAEDPPIPKGPYSPNERMEVKTFRNGIIERISQKGSVEAIEQLNRICQAYPDDTGLVRARAYAYKNLWQKQRTQLTYPESIKLLSDPDTSVIRNSLELMHAVESALQRFAHEAQYGSPPLVTFLWDEKKSRPFSEQRLSDFLKFYLEREWRGRRIIINREVEIGNLNYFGIGERSDLLIQTVNPDGNPNQANLCVVIEVKPDNKAKPAMDIADQLVKQYLDGTSRSCGIYLVGWFGQSKRNLEQLRKDAEKEAEQNTSGDIHIRSLVLDISHKKHTSKTDQQS